MEFNQDLSNTRKSERVLKKNSWFDDFVEDVVFEEDDTISEEEDEEDFSGKLPI